MKIKVDLSNFVVSSKQFAVFYIDPEELKTVKDVIQYICTTFELDELKGVKGFSLYEDIWYIPSNQSSYIFKEMNGIIRLFDDEEIVKNNEDNLNGRTVDIVNNNNNNNNTKDFTLKSPSPQISGIIPLEEEMLLQNAKLFRNKMEPIPMEQETKSSFPLVNNFPEVRTDIDLEGNCNKTIEVDMDKIDRKFCVTVENQDVDNSNISVCSFDTSLSSLNKKKRKRKHNKKAKNKKNVNYSDEKSHSIWGITSCSSENASYKTVEKYSAVRVHKIFNSEDEEENESNEQILNPRKRKIKENNYMTHFSETSKKDETQLDSSDDAHQHLNENQIMKPINIKTEVNSPEQQYLKNRQHFKEKIVKLLPPTVLADSHETPLDIKMKFKNLLALESRIKPKIFNRERGISCKQNGDISAFYSLPRSFVSKRYLGNCDKEEILSINHITQNFKSPKREKFVNKRFDISPYTNNYERKQTSEGSDLNQELICHQMDVEAQLSSANNFISSETSTENGKIFNAIGYTLKGYQNKNTSSIQETNKSDGDEILDVCVTDMSKSTQVFGDEENRLQCPSGSFSDQELMSFNLLDVEKAQSPVSLDNYVGCKPRKKNRKYFSSIGNTLRVLKYSNCNNRKDVNGNSNDKISCPKNPKEFNNKGEVVKPEKFRVSKQELSNYSYTNIPTSISGTTLGEINDIKIIKHIVSHPIFSKTNFTSYSTKSKDNTDTNDVNVSMNLDSNKEICTEKSETNLHQIEKPASKEESSKNQKINYESYPELRTLPKVGDIIATKILTIDSNMCPYYSEYRPAKIIVVEGVKLTLQFLDGDDKPLQENDNEVIIDDSSEITIDWRDLKSTRLIFP